MILLGPLAGWADEWWDYEYIDGLRDGYRIIAVDRLGHGASDKPDDPAEYVEHLIVSDIIAVLDAEQVDNVVVWGYSMGSRNATSLAVLAPERVSALICGGGAALPDADGRRERILGIAALMQTDQGLADVFRAGGLSDEEIGDALAHSTATALSAAWAGTAEWYPMAEDVGAPSLWYKGSDDDGGFTTLELELAARLGVETHLLPDKNHVTAFTEGDGTVDVVGAFLDSHHR